MISRISNTLGLALVLAAITACGGGGSGDEDDSAGGGAPVPVTTVEYDVPFSRDQVISGTAAPDGVTASASLRTEESLDIYAAGSVTVSGASPVAVTINAGYAGETRPVALSLEPAGGDTWRIPADSLIDRPELYRLQSSGYYVSIDTGSGELRGQILPPGWELMMVELGADAAVPASAATGTAKAGIAIDPAYGSVRVRVTAEGVGDAVGASVRAAIAGARGDVHLALEQSLADARVWGTRDVNDENADDRLGASGLDLLANGSLYVNLATASRPDGALRAQLLPEGVEVYTSRLTHFDVVSPGQPVDSDATGTSTITWRAANRAFGIAVTTDVLDAVAVYLQQGLPGENGPTLYTLVPDAALPGNWTLPMTALTPEIADALAAESLYVTVVTPRYAQGELRGQLALRDTLHAAEKEIGENGGVLAALGDDGTSYTLTIGPDALFEETVAMSMREAGDVPLPAGFTALAAVELQPSGTAFAVYPELEIDLAAATDPGVAKFAFIVSDDGSTVEFRPLLGDDDLLAAARAAGPARIDVPHFSVAGIAVADDDAAIAASGSNLTAEQVAKSKIVEHAVFVGNQQMRGLPVTLDHDYLAGVLETWYQDLLGRTLEPRASEQRGIGELLAETVRYVAASQLAGLEIDAFNRPATSNLYNALAGRIAELDETCLAGDSAATFGLTRWLGKTHRILPFARPADYQKPVVSCLVTARIEPEHPVAGVVGGPEIEYGVVLTGANGADLSGFVVLEQAWETPVGLSRQDGLYVYLDTSIPGLREAAPAFNLFKLAEPPPAQAVVVHDHTGRRQLFAGGFASCTNDPEESGIGEFLMDIVMTTQSTGAISGTGAGVNLGGSGSLGGISVDQLVIDAIYDDNTETSVDGSAGGMLTFTARETDPDTGEEIVNRGTLMLNDGVAADDLFVFPAVTGSDNTGCQLEGRIEIGEVL